MEAILNNLDFDRIADATVRQLLDSAMLSFYTFTLVLIRMSGLMIIGPIFGQSVVPTNVRVLLIVTLSMLITPTLHDQLQLAFVRLDVNQDSRLDRDETPNHLQSNFDSLLRSAGKLEGESLSAHEFFYPVKIPATILGYAWIIVGEFALGFVLGLGVMTILSGLQMAGQIIDRQAGIALGQVFNPGLGSMSTVTGTTMFLLGTAIFLVMEPVNGHLLMVSALIETFQAMPVGEAFVPISAIDLLRDLVQASFILAIQIAAPVLATMALLSLAMGFLGHTVPQINLLVVGFPVRVITSLLILSVTISGVGRIVVDTIPQVIDQLRSVLTPLS